MLDGNREEGVKGIKVQCRRMWYERKMNGKLEDVGKMEGVYEGKGRGRGWFKGKIKRKLEKGRNGGRDISG